MPGCPQDQVIVLVLGFLGRLPGLEVVLFKLDRPAALEIDHAGNRHDHQGHGDGDEGHCPARKAPRLVARPRKQEHEEGAGCLSALLAKPAAALPDARHKGAELAIGPLFLRGFFARLRRTRGPGRRAWRVWRRASSPGCFGPDRVRDFCRDGLRCPQRPELFGVEISLLVSAVLCPAEGPAVRASPGLVRG